MIYTWTNEYLIANKHLLNNLVVTKNNSEYLLLANAAQFDNGKRCIMSL
jgi:hypothetical protein